jgi:hypothetical protein
MEDATILLTGDTGFLGGAAAVELPAAVGAELHAPSHGNGFSAIGTF